MNILHFEKNFQYNDKQLLVVARKIGKLATVCSRIKDESSVIRIEAEGRDTKKDRDQTKVTITIELPQKLLVADSRKKDVLEALDRCVEKLTPQLEKYKELHSRQGMIKKARKHSRSRA